MSQPNQPGALVDEKTALIGGGLATILAVFAGLIAVQQILDIVGDLVWLGIGLYVLGLFVQYWMAQSYKDGLTVKEVTLAIFWPVDTIKTIRAGVTRQQLIGSLRGTHQPAQQDTSTTLIDEKTALYGGLLLTLFVGLPVVFIGIFSVLSIAGQLIWLGVLVYVVGFVANFWTSQSYKNGLTAGELTLNAVWPVDVVGKIRKGVTRQSATS